MHNNGAEALQKFSKDSVKREVIKPYFEKLGWAVQSIKMEEDLDHCCDLLLRASVHGESVLAGVRIESGVNIESRRDVLREIKIHAEEALKYRHGSNNREILYKYYWITTGHVEPLTYKEVHRELDPNVISRLEIWDQEVLYNKISESGNLALLGISEIRLQVFMSYASEDRAKVTGFYHRLQADGFEPWMDIGEMLPGQTWRQEIRNAMLNSDAIVIFLSEKGLSKSSFFKDEIKIAQELRQQQADGSIFLIPVTFEKLNPPQGFEDLHLTPIYEDNGYELLIRALKLRKDEITKGE
jgi:hypothetical protein